MTLIDLDGVAGAAAEPAAAAGSPRRLRSVLPVLAVACLLLLAASAPPQPSLVRRLWTVAFQPDDVLATAGRTVHLNRGGDAGRRTVTAYDVPTGRLRWSIPAGAAVAGNGVRPAGDVLLVPTEPPAGNGRGTVALDAATGAQLWRSAGEAFPSVAGGDALLAGKDEFGVYGYADGTVRHRGRLPWNGVYSATLLPAGRYLIVVRRASAQVVATIHRGADLRLLWRSDELIGSVTGCGTLICTAGARGVIGREPATGREIWRRTDKNFLWDFGGGRLLLSATANLASTTTVLVDTATGRTVVSRIDRTDGRQTVLGTVERAGPQDCRGTPGYLLCRRGNTLIVNAAG